MITSELLFDTRIDTMKYFVPMTISFKKRNYINKDGLSPIYMHVSSHGHRERIPLDIYVNPKYWNKKKSRLVGPQEEVEISNLLIDNAASKITKIKTTYKLSDRLLTMDVFLNEFKSNLSKSNFIEFFSAILEDRKATVKNSTYVKERSVWRKLNDYRPEILFHEITEPFIVAYRNHLARLGNSKTTRNANIKIIKKYLGFAVKAGVKLPLHLNDIKVGSTSGNKNYLNSDEVHKCFKYYLSDFIPINQKIALGYFLFGCFTGLRFSDIEQQERSYVLTGSISFTNVKTGKAQVVRLNKKALEIIHACDQLFIIKYSSAHVRKLVQNICKFLQISKHVDFHMSRHTFGTNYILQGGRAKKLQILMNHSNIKHTMIYVHLAELEENAEADLLDNMF